MAQTTIACGNCGRTLEERSDLAAEDRQPCPVCGSTARSFSVVVGAATAVAIAGSPRVHVEGVSADDTAEAEVLRGRYQATLDWQMLDNGVWLLQVRNEHGEVVEGGVGDDPEGALLEVYERLIPPK